MLDTDKVVVNLSNRILSNCELSILKKGLNFNLNKRQLSSFEVIPAIEPSLKCVTAEVANVIRHKVSATLLNQKPSLSNISKAEQLALKHLQQDKSIVITRADKGNTTVVLNTVDYEKKALEHLNNGPYEKVNTTKSRSTLNKLKAETSKMLQSIKTKTRSISMVYISSKKLQSL